MPDAMYDELAPWWPLLSHPDDYTEEAGFYTNLLRLHGSPRTVLELGSGGGNNASHMKAHFQLTLVDRSPNMLEVSRRLNPECEHIQGDMRDVRIGRLFDAVFIHDAIMYMATRADLLLAMQTAAAHCKPGGTVLLVPDFTREGFHGGTDHGGHDGEGRTMRYLEWVTDPDPDDEQFHVDYAFVLQTDGQPPRVVHERHTEGLFTESVWLDLAKQAGLEPAKHTVNHTGIGEATVFLCRRAQAP